MKSIHTLLASTLFLAVTALHAQALPAGVRFGMSAEELRAALPDLARVQRPQRLAGGLAGTWHAAPTQFAGVVFEPVFFFAGGELRRVEWVAAADTSPDPERGRLR